MYLYNMSVTFFFHFQDAEHQLQSPKNKELSRNQTLVAHSKLFNLILLKQISFDDLDSFNFRDFTKSVNEMYTLPSEEFLKMEVAPNVQKICMKSLSKEKLSPVVYVHSKRFEKKLFLTATTATETGRYAYLQEIWMDLDTSEEDNNLREKSILKTFCDSAVEKATAAHSVKILAVVYDCDVELSVEDKVNHKLKYHRLKCLSLLIKEIEVISLIIEEEEKLTKVKRLSESLKSANLTLSDASELLLQTLIDSETPFEFISQDLILSYVGPLQMGANFFNPKYKGHLASKTEISK